MAIEKLSEFAKDGQKNTDDLNLTDGFHVSKKPARQWFNWLFNSLTSKVNEIIDADFVPKADIVDNLTTDDAKKPVSAKQAKNLQDNKLDKTANAVSSSKLETARTVSFSGAATGSFNFDGSGNSSCVLALANSGVVASTYGAALKIPVLTVNAKGLITGVSEQNIPIVDDLTTNDSTKPISAKQAKNLKDNKLDKTANAVSATKLKNARKINGVNFDGSTDIDLPLIGVNQTWQNLTASRAAETIYTNTTGKPIQVAINYNGNNAYFDIGGVEIYMPDYNAFGFAFFIIPNGTTYRIRNQVGINSWSELR